MEKKRIVWKKDAFVMHFVTHSVIKRNLFTFPECLEFLCSVIELQTSNYGHGIRDYSFCFFPSLAKEVNEFLMGSLLGDMRSFLFLFSFSNFVSRLSRFLAMMNWFARLEEKQKSASFKIKRVELFFLSNERKTCFLVFWFLVSWFLVFLSIFNHR